MGFCHEPTPAMGEFSVETRGESFYLRRKATIMPGIRGEPDEVEEPEGIIVYPSPGPHIREKMVEEIIRAARGLDGTFDSPRVKAAKRADFEELLSRCIDVGRRGSVEFLLADVTKIKAALEQASE